ncbi:MAG: hypothetical protein OER95_05240, partial [Acidimicrobiia bacterium]|nr:hypothetical protein [Acidimicrobiia bacterium]
GRALARWDAIDHGDALRRFAIPILALVAWYGSTYEYNYVLDRWHLVDRLLVVALAIGATARPIALVPLVIQARLVAGQFLVPLGVSAGYNIGDLLAIVLLVLAAGFIVAATTSIGRWSIGSAVVPVVAAAVAAHFFVPGVSKLRMGWLDGPGVHHFALNAHAAGWLGGGDGSWAGRLAGALESLRWPILVVTLVLETGAVVAITRRWLLCGWLVGWILLHGAIFAASGYWLFEWVAVELGLLVLLIQPGAARWLEANHRPARAAVAALLVLGGTVLFHPPRLAWFDANVAYGFEVDVVDGDGRRTHVPLDELEPLQQNLSLTFAWFGPTAPLVGGYGAVLTLDGIDRLAAVTDFDELRRLEGDQPPTTAERQASSELLMTRWAEHVARGPRSTHSPISPPSRFWTNRPPPRFDGADPPFTVEVLLVRSLADGPDQQLERQLALRMEVDEAGQARVVDRLGDDPRSG